MDAVTVQQRWREYIRELFSIGKPEMEDAAEESEGPEILENETKWTMNDMKKGKAAGSDGVTLEMLQTFGNIAVKSITGIANKDYSSGQTTEQCAHQCLL